MEYGYGAMPKAKQTLASYLFPGSASAGACLHTVSIQQAYQANLLRDLNDGKGIGPV